MRKWFCALALGALILVPAMASAQFPKPTYLATKNIKWRVSVSGVNSQGYVDSTAKDLSWNATSSTATAVCTTQAIPTDDWALIPQMLGTSSVTSNQAVGPKFYFTSPNTSTADSLSVSGQFSFDGVTWFDTGGSQTMGGFSTVSNIIASQTTSANLLCTKATDLTAYPPWPMYRLIVSGSSKSQTFSAARVTMRYLSVNDGQGVGNGVGYGCWKMYEKPIYWSVGPSDSLARSLAADDPDTTTAISLADVDWSTQGAALQNSWGRLFLYSADATFKNLDTIDDSLYVVAEFSLDGVNWTKSGGTLANAASYFGSTSSDGVAEANLCGAQIADAASNGDSAFGAGYVRFIIKCPEAKTVGRVKIAFMYPSRSCY